MNESSEGKGIDPRDGRGQPRPLRRKVLLAGSATTLAILTGIAALILLSLDARTNLRQATDAFIQEQRMADEIGHAVMRQLAAASVLSDGRAAPLPPEFQVAGDEVYVRIRQYLFQDLSTEERLLVEEMGEAHQRLEVTLARSGELAARGNVEAAEAARQEMLEHVSTLLQAIDGFMDLREAEVQSLRDRQDASFRFIYLIGGLLAVLTLAGTVISARLFRQRVTTPLAQFARASERFGAGELDVRVPEARDREFQTVADGFNRMAARLQRTTRELEERNRELSSTLESLRETQQELIQSEKLSAMGRMTAGMAHELNNPLASVLGYGQLLSERVSELDQEVGDELAREFLDPILQEAERAQHLVRNFLHFSRRSDTELGPVSLEETLDVIVALRGYAFRQAGLELEVAALPDPPVWADRQLLQGVLLNLVNNAFDAMEPQGSGRLLVTGRLEDEEVQITFEDDGPGLAEPDRVFEPFFTTKPVGEGTGLGLALAHRFMKVFGGSIHAGNRPSGGARFVLRFRVASAEDGSPVAPDTPLPPSWSRPTDDPGPRILVVEDEEPLRRLQERLLGRLNAQVLLAPEAASARRILATEEVDAVISDVKMPGEDGLSFYRWLEEAHPELARRFVFVTGDVSGAELVALAERSPDLFIHKPFEMDEYLARVCAILG